VAKRKKPRTHCTPEKSGEPAPPSPPAPARPGPDPDRTWEAPFLAALAITGVVTYACRAAPVPPRTAYYRREQDEDFARQWREALEESTDDLVLEARRRALQGVRKFRFHQGDLIRVPLTDEKGAEILDETGQPVMVPYVEHEYSDTLIIFLLKAHRPAVYRETFRHEHTGDPRPFTFVEVPRDAPDPGSDARR
jgi:hypothetical protein